MSDTENLDIKKRARRRLVGAVALALLAAVVLPMIMDQEPHRAVQDIQITIPDRDAVAALPRPSPAGESQPPVAAVPVPEDDELAASDKAAAAVAEPAAKPAAEAAVAPATPPRSAQQQAQSPQPAAPRTEPPPAKSPAAPEPRPATPSAEEEARVRAILSGQAVPPRGESFVLQIGAFSDAGKAAKLVDDLRARGFSAYTERAGNVTRVRVGPVAGRAEADATAARLKSAGHAAVLQAR